MLKRKDIRIRDPYILTDKENGCYYMYGTTALEEGSILAKNTFSVYKTADLENFEEPKVVFDGAEADFWADRDFWAPEVHKYGGKYYMFGSCRSETHLRGTHIFVCDTPDGVFVPVSELPATPAEWESLDGTLWIDNGTPYMIFCHEHTQVLNGEMCAVELSDDLARPIGEPILLFHATDNPDVNLDSRGHAVTDGPFLYVEDGKLRMIWSSFCNGRYAVLEAESEDGTVCGKWIHHGSRYAFDGGHAMLFERLDGKRMISLHSPNATGLERAKFMEY